MSSCLLFSNSDKSIVLVDIPRSIELAQLPKGQTTPSNRRLLSCQPLAKPWQNQVSSKSSQEPNMSQSASALIDELMACETVRHAHKAIRDTYHGDWHLPRTCAPLPDQTTIQHNTEAPAVPQKRKLCATELHHGDSPEFNYIPADSKYLLGSIESQRDSFLKTAPQFDIVVLDPPWPSRSVRRKKKNSYSTTYDMTEMHDLLSLIPIASHLKLEGIVAVWVTNKPAVIDLLKSPGGLFDQWNVEPIGEWIWVKVTSNGEPIVDFGSTWRKPWERLLFAKRRGSSQKLQPERKVVFAVPDLHSRKPNIRMLLEDFLPNGYLGLEVFSRNLTAGWWSWGDQTLLFQQKQHWVDDSATEKQGPKTLCQ
ncbi:hypothetical protein PFICI_04591 [Pestalotiopsis fici W106-1]|uniref:MT-A70-domain-containing protein n=1 Tax=Pestalotiopsis fici (strain W106-1 / CGMCC3.15140) TaxID=1229662 RepID=W3X9I6_PESFW|nr:uncharacterized protein PFICI_04591 [Pestalotiopsis fici W106-1]ETS82715.1 hypothetical protein PFICI_04591 [Pestalotiopsis fici W106-1]